MSTIHCPVNKAGKETKPVALCVSHSIPAGCEVNVAPLPEGWPQASGHPNQKETRRKYWRIGEEMGAAGQGRGTGSASSPSVSGASGEWALEQKPRGGASPFTSAYVRRRGASAGRQSLRSAPSLVRLSML